VPEGIRWYAYLGTGNFNEKTARIYADDGLFTADQRIAGEVRKVFDFLTGDDTHPSFEHLLVAPFYLRKEMYRLIENEVQAAEEGERARMILKMNSIEDEKIIRRLYEASTAGVDIEMIIRGICCLVPGIPGQSENIQVRTIVDRFLEHSRVFIFHNRGEEKVYLSSADWMSRNLSRRVEVAFPIYDPDIKREMREILQLQRRDNTKARILDAEQTNAYVGRGEEDPVRAQIDTYELLSYKCESIEPRRVGMERE
jgi:polyphosphate kinase